ncbi:hypothetical protein MD484_g3468, partial [Candolleomyces efflorescens]
MKDGVLNNVDTFIDHSHWAVRSAFIQILANLGVHSDCELPDTVFTKIRSSVISDSDHSVRSVAIDALSTLASDPEGRYHDKIQETIKEDFEAALDDFYWNVRERWGNLVSLFLKDGEFPGLSKFLKVVIETSDPSGEPMKTLQHLLSDAKIRASVAPRLGKALASSLAVPPQVDGINIPWASLTEITRPDPERLADFQALPKLIEQVVKEAPNSDTFEYLDTLLQGVKLSEPIETILPKSLELALRIDPSKGFIRSAAIRLFGALLGHTNSQLPLGPSYENLLGRSSDSQIMARLADIATKDADFSCRNEAIDLFKVIYNEAFPRWRDPAKATLPKLLENHLKGQDAVLRDNAIFALESLTITKPNQIITYTMQYDLLLQPLPSLVKNFLVDGDDYRLFGIENILFVNLKDKGIEYRIAQEMFMAIPSVITNITTAGKNAALRLIETHLMTSETAVKMAHLLAPALRNASSLARTAAVELLSAVYARNKWDKPFMIESSISEIINLALDDKDDVGGIRSVSIKLLAAFISATRNPPVVPLDGGLAQVGTVSKQIIPLAAKFMALLEVEHLRPSVVELLSEMSIDTAVRETITLRIISALFGSDSIGATLVGHAELLTQLISEGRFEDTATDYMVIFLASTWSTLPQLSAYRLKVLTSLSVRYSYNTIRPRLKTDPGLVKDLVDWFTLALFGRHATGHEVTTWGSRCGIWLAATRKESDFESEVESEPEPILDKELVQEPEEMSILARSDTSGRRSKELVQDHEETSMRAGSGTSDRRSGELRQGPEETTSIRAGSDTSERRKGVASRTTTLSASRRASARASSIVDVTQDR